MGLDMYLSKRLYIGNNYRKERGEELLEVIVPKSLGIKVDNSQISEIVLRAGYWRKANAVHNWIIENCADGEDNGQDIYLAVEQMKELLDICKKIKKSCKLVKGKIKNGQRSTANGWEDIIEDGLTIENPEVAQELLPTAEGFFFGSTDYDEYYMKDIDDTIKILEEALDDGDGDYYYHASW